MVTYVIEVNKLTSEVRFDLQGHRVASEATYCKMFAYM